MNLLIGDALGEVAPSILLTSLTETAAFLLGVDVQCKVKCACMYRECVCVCVCTCVCTRIHEHLCVVCTCMCIVNNLACTYLCTLVSV